jgi:hypothetical protein
MPTPEDDDINWVREIAGESDYSFVSGLITSLTDATWERALDLITEWQKVVAGDLVALKGGRDGVILSDQEGLNDIRARMRLLLGLSEFRDASLLGGPASIGVRTQWWW